MRPTGRLDPTTIQDFEIENDLAKVHGKIVIAFLDTCFSGGLHPPDVNRLANELESPQTGVVVFTSSTGNEASQENKDWNNDAFTKALVEAFKGKGGIGQFKDISIIVLEDYLERRVTELTHGQQHPTLAKPETKEGDFVIATVVP